MIHQGDIYLANLNPTFGHEQSGYRPVLVLQNDSFNKHLNTAIVIPFTSNLKAKGKSSTYYIEKNLNTGLMQDSVLLLFQIKTIDIRRLEKKIGIIPREQIPLILQQLRFLF